MLGFGVDDALATVESEMDREQRCVADHPPQTLQALGVRVDYRVCSYHWAT
jgi:hypothetical protein